MSARHFMLSGFACAAAFQAACVSANELPLEPVLGQAVPIGRLLLVSAGGEDEAAPPAPIPQLDGGVIPLPFEEAPQPLGSAVPAADQPLPQSLRPQPLEIQRHLSHAAAQLAAAGLTDEAHQVGTLLNQFQAKHYTRLLLAQKQFQLEALQAEVNELRAAVTPAAKQTQVMLSMKFIEGPAEVLNRLAPRLAAVEDQDQPVRVVDDQALWKAIQESKTASRLTILSAPTVTTYSGHSAQVITGGELSPSANLLVKSTDEPADFHGTKVFATATVLSAEVIRLSLAAECSSPSENQTVSAKDASASGVSVQRIESLTEVHDGETLAYHVSGHEQPMLLLVKTTIVKPETATGAVQRNGRSVTPAGRTEDSRVR